MNPGNFPLGSHQSRAAARALLANRQAAFDRRKVILGCSANDGSAPHATEWHANAKEQTAGRVVSLPEGMTLADGLRMLGGYSEAELEKISTRLPGARGGGFSTRTAAVSRQSGGHQKGIGNEAAVRLRPVIPKLSFRSGFY
jgi:hypothetical protein